MAVDRIIAEIKRRRREVEVLVVKPRGSDEIRADLWEVHSGFLELVTKMVTIDVSTSEEISHEPLTYFVPFNAIDYVVPRWR